MEEGIILRNVNVVISPQLDAIQAAVSSYYPPGIGTLAFQCDQVTEKLAHKKKTLVRRTTAEWGT